MITDRQAIEAARGAWLALAPMRSRRRRLKAFTYGRQWGDTTLTTDGRRISEAQKLAEEGRTPVTNNIIRQMVKSIIGRYRYMCGAAGDGDLAGARVGADLTAASVSETDARALEEFLISGMAVQRIEGNRVENVSPERFFYHEFMDGDGSDLRLAGILRDMTVADVLERFAGGDVRRARELKRVLAAERAAPDIWPRGDDGSFDMPRLTQSCRVVELWRLIRREALMVTDPFTGETRAESADALERLEGINRARAECGTEPLRWEYRVDGQWECEWLTPRGAVLGRARAERCPVALKFYPLIDGEVHSLVEDVVDQQKYVNRLVSLLDHIISSSAKGVLLYPADQLPEGFTWRDLRRIWANPMGILPFRRTSKTMTPMQVNGGGNAGAGAADMLKMQLQLFDEISGATGALRGRSASATGEGMLRAELENATVSMLDVLAAFRSFVLRRDRLMAGKNVGL